jgi:lycopene cyclase domain-containing protein
MSYTILAVLAVAAAMGADLGLLRSRVILSSTFWLSYAILLFFQLIMNGALTGLSVVRYDPHTITGLRLAYAPVEDIAFGFALITLTLSCWIRLSTARPVSTER